jgi:hypothetical protein
MENTTKKLKRRATRITSKIESEIYYFQFSLADKQVNFGRELKLDTNHLNNKIVIQNNVSDI